MEPKKNDNAPECEGQEDMCDDFWEFRRKELREIEMEHGFDALD